MCVFILFPTCLEMTTKKDSKVVSFHFPLFEHEKRISVLEVWYTTIERNLLGSEDNFLTETGFGISDDHNWFGFKGSMKYDPTSSVSPIQFLLNFVASPPYKNVTHSVLNGGISTKVAELDDPCKNFLLGRSFENIACIARCETSEVTLTENEFILLWASRNNRLALVTGTGLSRQLTDNQLALWSPFLLNLRQSVWPDDNLGSFDLNFFNNLSADPHAQSEYLYARAKDDHRENTLVAQILRVISGLLPVEPVATAWRNTLLNFVGPILTFNYDISLEVAIGRIPISSSEGNLPELLNSKMAHHVVHLHGIFTEQSAVLNQDTYLSAVQHVSNAFVTLAKMGFVFVYVGVNGFLNDPDLSPYWRWEDVQHTLKHRKCKKSHFVIFKDNENPPFPRRSDHTTEYPFFQKVSYTNHSEISSIFNNIATGQYRGV